MRCGARFGSKIFNLEPKKVQVQVGANQKCCENNSFDRLFKTNVRERKKEQA